MTLPLAAALSKVLVAYTIEYDNAFESRIPHTTARGPQAHSRRGPWLVSMPMWSNFLCRLDPGGTPLSDVDDLAKLVNLPGLDRWGYVALGQSKVVTLTPGGRRAVEVFAPLAAEIESRWQARFGIDDLRAGLTGLVAVLDAAPVGYLPVVGVRPARPPVLRPRPDPDPLDLATLLSRVLLAFTTAYERDSPLALVVAANVLRALPAAPVRVRDLPAATGTSRESVTLAAALLERAGCLTAAVDNRARTAHRTGKGRRAQQAHARRVAAIEADWSTRTDLTGLRAALDRVLTHPDLATGLTPPPEGWRANPPYAALTGHLLADPAAALPHHPVVSHRGGYPDGS
jgi:hypothetical protein